MEQIINISIDVDISNGMSASVRRDVTVVHHIGEDDPLPDAVDKLLILLVKGIRNTYSIPEY